ncbi:MAG: M4 family metallopeptidase [Acidobacteria bacterium]|nr:M4 family metallopeptidase [Acidobacteriota bacterium]
MKKILSASILVLMATGAAFAQSNNANPRALEASMAHFRANAKAYGLTDADRELKQTRGFTDKLGKTHVRFDQYFNGVRVFEGEAISHVDSKGRVAVTNALRKDLRVNTTPSISDATAVSIAMARMNAVGGYDNPSATLVVLPAGERSASTRLTWHVRAFVENDATHPAQYDFFVDAHTGEVAFSFDSLETAKPGSGGGSTAAVAATATGRTMWSGDVTLDVNHPTSTSWTLQDTGRGIGSSSAPALGNYTLDMNKRSSGGSIVSRSTASFGDGSRNNTDVATAAADAHYGLQKTWDYFKLVHGRNGIDGNGSKTFSRVHYNRNYENAFWSDSCFCMTYGDGASTFYPLVSIDVAGHEMTHGVTSRTARLTYSGESGGLNEATSDIFGTAVEFYSGSATDVADWWIGERIWRSNWSTGSFVQARALRHMDDPAKDGRSPACWSSTLGSLDVHYSSGPANHMFYLLANGGTSKCNSNNVAGLGIDKAAKIWFRALTVYMTASTNYAAARTAALNAASDLYGASSAERAAVAAAFSGINVN